MQDLQILLVTSDMFFVRQNLQWCFWKLQSAEVASGYFKDSFVFIKDASLLTSFLWRMLRKEQIPF